MKKFLISTIIFSIILFACSSMIFAANLSSDAKNTTASIGNAIKNTAEDVRNVVGNTENGIENGVMDTKNAISGTTETVENGVQNTANDVMGSVNNMDGTYTAERTSTNSGFMGMTSTGWTWLVLGIVGIVIVGLVWYYGSQYEHTDYSDGE